MLKRNLIVCLGLLFSLCQAFSQTKYEAEDATSNSCVSATSSAASGGKYVKMQEGSLTFDVTVASEGLYLMTVYYSQTYGDQKTQNLSVNGSSAGSVDFPKTSSATDFQAVKVALTLANGANKIAITKSWGWVDIDYITIGAVSMDGFELGDIVTPSSTEGAKKLYAFLKENFGKKTVSGAMLGNMDNTSGTNIKSHEDISVFYNMTGKYPALVGVDFMNATGQSAYSSNVNESAYFSTYTERSLSLIEEVWALGGIPKFTWHWRDPSLETDQFYYLSSDHSDGTTFDFTEAMNEDGSWNKSSAVYQSMIKDIDVIASHFLALQEKGVAGIFRPLHEASGGWFWWGKQGGENYAKLYRLVYDEMVNVKGVKNLLWVWNPNSASDASWDPGEQYYDIVSADIYTYNSSGAVYHVYDNQVGTYMKLMDLTDSKKIIALTECGSIPAVENCYSETTTVAWSWWMPWYESWDAAWVTKGTEKDVWVKAMTSDYIITLDEMEGWGTYTGTVTPSDPTDECSKGVANGIYEVECSKDHKTSDVSVTNKSGQGVLMLKNNDDYINLTVSLEKAGAYKVYVGYNSIYGYKKINCAVNSIGSQVDLGDSSSDSKVDATAEALAGSFNFKAGDNVVTLTPDWTYAIVDYVRIEADADAPSYSFKVSDVDGFKVDGSKLLDRCNNEFIMKGVNLAYTWYESSAYNQLKAIHNAGANAVRIVLTNGKKYGKAADDASKVKQIVDSCKAYGMVAIIEVHDETGSDEISDLKDAATYFANMASTLKGTEPYVIINIANEWHNSSTAQNWCDGYKEAIPVIRNAGLRHCIMVDAGGYGQGASCIHSYGQAVLDADVDNNVIFSIHMYGNAGNTSKVKSNIDGVINQDLALCIGEFGWYHSDGDVDEELILSYCKEKNVGWLAWSWYGNGSPVEYLDIVKDASATPVLASYTNLTINNWNNTQSWTASSDWGKTVTDAWKTDIKYASLSECAPTSLKLLENDSPIFYADGFLFVRNSGKASLLVTDLSGKTLISKKIKDNATVSMADYPSGVYLVSLNGKTLKVIK